MAPLSISISTLCFLVVHLLILNSISCLSIPTLDVDNSKFDPPFALLGGAEVAANGSYVEFKSSSASSSGLLVYRSPFRFIHSGPDKITSFATEFSFSLTGNNNRLSLLMGPYNFTSEFIGQGQFGILNARGHLGIEFGTSRDGNVGDSNTSLVAVSVNNVSSSHLVINNGERLKSWVDYDGSSKRLEVRLSKAGDKRPFNPIMAYGIDLPKLWGDKEFYVGLGSSNGKSAEACLYSWRFRLRKFPNWMHSLPADPHSYMDKHNEVPSLHRRRFCPFAVFAGMIFATGCGALLAFVVLSMWAVFVSRRSVFPIDGDVLPVDFRYEKINLVVEKDVKDAKT